MQRASCVSLLAVSASLLLAACADEPTRPEAHRPTAATNASLTPAAPLSFRQVSTGGLNSCGVSTAGAAYCWGDNRFANLGSGSNQGPELCGDAACSTRPVRVVGRLAFKSLDVSGGHTCGVATDDVVYCWGDNSSGQLGIGNNTGPERCPLGNNDPCSTRPVRVIGGLHFRQVSAGGGHTCGVTASNVAFCWGDNQFGALGDGTTIQRLRPRRVAGGLAFRSVEAGENHTCGVTLSYVTYCWGTNHVAHLGHGTTTGPQTCHTFLGDLSCSTRPVRVVGGHLFRQVGAGGDHNCAVTRANVPFCWGRNDLGELGTGTFDAPEICEVPLEELPCSSRPLRVTGRLLLRQISTGTHHTCGVNTSNVAYCWGYGQGGQLGDGTEDIRATPKRVAGGHQFRHVSGAAYHTCGVTTDGVAYCWGLNQIGEVGDGTGTQRLTPVAVAPPAP